MLRSAFISLTAVAALSAQEQPPPAESPAPVAAASSVTPAATPAATTPPTRTDANAKPDDFVVAVGTRIPLSMINSISTKTAAEG